MKPLYILLGSFLVTLAATKIFESTVDYPFAGKTALSIMLLFTSLGHFMFTSGMSKMLPAFIPWKRTVIYITGILEILAAVGIHIESIRIITGSLLIIFLICVLPSNIYAAKTRLNYETGKHDGNGLSYLWFRIPFQLFLIWWVYFFSIR